MYLIVRRSSSYLLRMDRKHLWFAGKVEMEVLGERLLHFMLVLFWNPM